MFRYFISAHIVIIVLLYAGHSIADTNTAFQFSSIKTLDEMSNFIRQHFSLGSYRRDLRQVFVTEGQATLKIHPLKLDTEKYIYDINLCHYYIWRWNISADYDADKRLQQAYLNGNTVFPKGKPKKVVSKVAKQGNKASIYKVKRPRPQAYKGENSLSFLLFDRDSNTNTINDQIAVGTGPSRVNPANMGKMFAYIEVDPWRSIFDKDDADYIAPYKDDCTAIDKLIQSKMASQTK